MPVTEAEYKMIKLLPWTQTHETKNQESRPLDAGIEKVKSHFNPPVAGRARRHRPRRHELVRCVWLPFHFICSKGFFPRH
jgi:hypothetical protein